MITDSYLRLSEGQGAITATQNSTNTIDLSVAREIGEGEEINAVFIVTVTGTGTGTVTLSIVTADDAALTTNVTTLVASAAFVGTTLIAVGSAKPLGTSITLRLPPVIASLGRRYLGAVYTVSGTVGAVKFTTDIVVDIQDGQKYYASGFSIV